MIPATTTFRWREGRGDVVARLLAQCDAGSGRTRAVLIDTADRLFVADVYPDGPCHIVAGPVTPAEALAKAEAVIAGGKDHGSVTCLVTTLAVALAAQTYRAEAHNH